MDGSGAQLATAEMDTKRFYAESGRVTVPLKLSASDSIELGEDYQGTMQYAITALQQNVPTRITAIVYLDGTTLTNDQVLAASDIQGQLNIQFGSSQSLKPIDNETLAGKELRVSASVDKTEFDYDTHVGEMKSRVTVRVDGDEPTMVKAFFLRQISTTQGSREPEMVFTKDGEGNWVADHVFTAPGKYVLRSVELDGITRDLEIVPEVNISGFAIESLSCTEETEGQITILSAQNSSTVDLALRFATDDPTKMPTSVQGRFLHDVEGSAVNVNFTYNPTTGLWTGSATFLTSGDYTMEYLVLNGEYEKLPNDMILKADVTLGMRVAIWTNSPTQFKYLGDQMPENQRLLSMQVKILDNADEEMPGLPGAKLKYSSRGQNRTMDTDLTWNGSSGYYEGELTSNGAGIWEFEQVTVGGNTLTTATTSPTFTMIPPDPPAFADYTVVPYQYVPQPDTGKMYASFSNASTAVVEAVVRKGSSKGNYEDQLYYVVGQASGTTTDENNVSVTDFIFNLPGDVQDGYWVMDELHVRNYFTASGDFVSADKDENGNYVDEPMVIDMRGQDTAIKVVQTVNVSFADGQSKNFGKDASGKVTGTFMQSHTVSGLSVNIRDFENKPVEGIKDVKLSFAYKDGLKTNSGGGESSVGLTSATDGATVTVTLTADSGSTTYQQRTDAAIVFAGNYTTTLSYTVGGQTTTLTDNALPFNAPVFTVWSAAPTATISAAKYKSSAQNDTSSSTINSGVSTTVYHSMSKTEICGLGLTTNYTSAYVEISLSGYGRASGATLKFTTDRSDGVVYLYADGQQNKGDSGTKTDSFQWRANGTCKRYVGWVNQKDNSSDEKANAGTLTARTLVLSYGGADYSFTLPSAITISNPAQ